jgi:hypothetical protein
MYPFLVEQFALAKDQGIQRPTFLLCATACEQAQAIHRVLTGKPLELAEATQEWGPLHAVETAEACRLLREHGGASGACVADHLADELVQAEAWVVLLMAAGLRFVAFAGGKQLTGGEARWDRVSHSMRPISQVRHDDGPSHVRLRLDGGELAQVFGPTGADAVMASALLAIVQSGKLTVDHPLTGKPIEIEVDDTRLEDLLAKVYANGNGPRQIAEAIQALKRLPGDPSRRLVRLLRDRPSLHRLHLLVQQELPGGLT